MRLIVTTDTVGGVWTFTKELAIDLLKRGHHVCLVSFGRAPTVDQVLWTDRTCDDYSASFRNEVSEVPLEWMPANDHAFTDGAARLLDVVEKFQPDVILSSQFCFGAMRCGVPVVVVAHSDVLSWAAACGEELEGGAWLDTYKRLVRDGVQGASAVVAPTLAALDDLQDHFGELASKAHVIANGRTALTAPAQHRNLQAISVGRLWDRAKNLHLLAHVQSPMPLLVAGEGGASSPANVTWLGSLTELDVLGLFRESAVYICTSLYEPFGLAPLEAALCGCALLLPELPSLYEVWGDSATYFRDAATLSAALHHLAGDANTLRAAQEKSSAHAHTYTAERMTTAYLQLLHDVLAKAERRANAA